MNNIIFENEETKKAYEEFIKEVQKYNAKIKSGEKTDTTLEEILFKYRDKFEDSELEETLKNIDSASSKDASSEKIDKLLEKINHKLENK